MRIVQRFWRGHMADQRAGRSLIVVADDHRDHNYTVAVMLNSRGYDVVSAYTGEETVRVVRAHAPAAILMDIQLPDVDGYRVCQTLKADAATADVPVVLYTARIESGVRAKRVGAAAFLTYPMEPEHLAVVLTGVIAKSAHPKALSARA
jgi:CheY-like chemotaxis protein